MGLSMWQVLEPTNCNWNQLWLQPYIWTKCLKWAITKFMNFFSFFLFFFLRMTRKDQPMEVKCVLVWQSCQSVGSYLIHFKWGASIDTVTQPTRVVVVKRPHWNKEQNKEVASWMHWHPHSLNPTTWKRTKLYGQWGAAVS